MNEMPEELERDWYDYWNRVLGFVVGYERQVLIDNEPGIKRSWIAAKIGDTTNHGVR